MFDYITSNLEKPVSFFLTRSLHLSRLPVKVDGVFLMCKSSVLAILFCTMSNFETWRVSQMLCALSCHSYPDFVSFAF